MRAAVFVVSRRGNWRWGGGTGVGGVTQQQSARLAMAIGGGQMYVGVEDDVVSHEQNKISSTWPAFGPHASFDWLHTGLATCAGLVDI
jgi:hypothetical protein